MAIGHMLSNDPEGKSTSGRFDLDTVLWSRMKLQLFDILFVSRSLVVDGSGNVPTEFPQFRFEIINKLGLSDRLVDFSPLSPKIVESIESILPTLKVSAENVKIYGDFHGSEIELWPNAIIWRFNPFNITPEIINKIVSFAKKFDCLLVYTRTGKVMFEDLDFMTE
jgi:hypothetical protein